MPNTTITQFGLDYASSASPSGTLIAPIFWVPVYDPRIDTLIHDSSNPVSAFSATVNPSATSPTGEIIWNVSATDYSLSDANDNFIIKGASSFSAGTQASATINDPVQSQKWQINLKDGIPLSDHYHGDSAVYNPVNDTWAMTNLSLSAGSNPFVAGKNKFFHVIDYYPVSADTPDSKLRGMVKCRLGKDIGTVKFNAVALYIEGFNASGVESPNEPVFFAQAQLKTTVVKTSMGTNGFDDMTVDVQIDLHSISANWNDVFFSTSGDYWSRVPDGIYYPERVGIGSFIDSILSPQASIHARRTRAMVSLGITDAPIARFDFDDNNFMEIDVNDSGMSHHIFSAGGAGFGLEYDPSSLAIYPDDSSPTVRFGSSTNRFSQMFLKQGGIDILDGYSNGYARTYFNGGAGGHIQYTDNMRMDFDPFIVADAQVSAIAYIGGADIRRTDEPINFYTLHGTTDPELNIISDIDPNAATLGNNIWGTVSSPLPTGQYGVTHKNILWQIANAAVPKWTKANAIMRLFGRGEIDLYGPVGLDALTLKDQSNTYDFGMLFSRRTNVLIAAGVLPATNLAAFLGTVNTGLTSLIGGASNASQWASVLAQLTTAPEFVMLGGLYHAGNISPVTDANYTLGSGGIQNNVGPTHARDQIRYKKLFVQSIGAYNAELIDADFVYEDNRVETIFAKDIGLGLSNAQRVNRMSILGMVNTTTMDIGVISSDSVLGDTVYPYTTINGIWPKRYAQLGINTDFANVGATISSPQYADGQPGGRSFWLSYINNMYATHELGFWQAFTIRGVFRGQNGLTITDSLTGSSITNVQLYNGGDVTALDWPGIHKVNTTALLTLGDGRPGNLGYIDAIYAAQLTATNIAATNAVIQNLTVPSLNVGTDLTLNMNTSVTGIATPVDITYRVFNNKISMYIPPISAFTVIRPDYRNLGPACSALPATTTNQRYPRVLGPHTFSMTGSYTLNNGQYVIITVPTAASILNSSTWFNTQWAYAQVTSQSAGIVTVNVISFNGALPTDIDRAMYLLPAFPRSIVPLLQDQWTLFSDISLGPSAIAIPVKWTIIGASVLSGHVISLSAGQNSEIVIQPQ